MAVLQKLLETKLASTEFYIILLSIVLLILTVCIIKSFERNRYYERGFPGLKIKWYYIHGHLNFLPRGAPYKRLSPRNAYLMHILEGLRTLHQKETGYTMWLFYTLYTIFYKAETFEKILTSTTILEKAESYTMLHPWLGTGLLTSKGQKWKSRRKLLTPSFHFDILKDFLPVFNEQTQVLIDVLKKESSKEWINIINPVTLCSLDIICETTLGVNINAQLNQDSEYVQAVFRLSATTMERMTNVMQWLDLVFYLSKTGRQYTKDLIILHNFTREVIQKKKALLQNNTNTEQTDGLRRKRKALMDLLLDHHMNHQDITEEDICEEVDTFAFEGHDTTSMGLSWSLYLIGLHSEVQDKVWEELYDVFRDDDRHVTTDDLKNLKYLDCVIKEALRLYPSVPIIGRRVTEEISLEGRTIPKNSEILLFTYGLHRNPEVFPNPEHFDPDRFLPENAVGRHPFAYVPFAAGPRNCIGQRFAMMELKVVLANILRNFEVRSLEHRDKLPVTAELILRPAQMIKMKVIPRRKTN